MPTFNSAASIQSAITELTKKYPNAAGNVSFNPTTGAVVVNSTTILTLTQSGGSYNHGIIYVYDAIENAIINTWY